MNAPGASDFALNPADYGLPTREELRKLRIWDMHYHGLWEGNLKKHAATLDTVDRMGIERLLSLDIAGTPADPLGKQVAAGKKKEIREFLEKNSDRICGLIPIDPSDPLGSCQKIEEWIVNGPCVGIKYYGGNPGGVRCSHADNDVIIRQAAKLNALVYIHTWLQVGGEPRRPGGAQRRRRVHADRCRASGPALSRSAPDLRSFRRRLGTGRGALSGRSATCTSSSVALTPIRDRSISPWPRWGPTASSGEDMDLRARIPPNWPRYSMLTCPRPSARRSSEAT